MGAEGIIGERVLADGLKAVIHDATRHYFGGYYHASLLVTADVPLLPAWFDTPQGYEDALNRLGSSVRFSRNMEKMAVPLGDMEEVRRSLMDAFEANLLVYLSRPDFPRRFVMGEYEKALQQVSSRGYGHQ